MRIVDADLVAFGGPLSVAAENASHVWSERRGLLLALTDDEGRVGQGEASPLPGFSHDSLDRARACLRAVPFARVVLDPESDPLPQVERLLDFVDPSCPSARFALETALLDLVGQRRGLPVHRLLRPETEPHLMTLAALVGSGDRETALDHARRARELGFRCLKIKIGRDFKADLATLVALREALGDDVVLRLDANGRLDCDDVFSQLLALSEVAPELVEEPVPLQVLLRMRPSPVPVALDESLHTTDAEMRLASVLDGGRAQALVLKPMALGGVLRCLRLAEIGSRRGADVIVSHLVDGPVGRAAAGELALALGGARPVGLGPHPGLGAWPRVATPAFHEATLRPHDRPGLGIEPLRGATAPA